MDEYIVSARKYRPLNFDSVVGQLSLTTTLKNSIKSGKLAHAYGLNPTGEPRTPESLLADFSWDKVPKGDICLPEGLF